MLVQLAEGGLVNPKCQADLRQLVRKGLIRRDPAFRLMNETFRAFIRSESRPEEVSQWEREGAEAGWGRWSGALGTLLLGLAAFLYFTQREVYQSSMEFVTAIVAAIPVVLKLLDLMAGARAGKAAPVG